MDPCPNCGWPGVTSDGRCQRCQQVRVTSTVDRPILRLKLQSTELPGNEWRLDGPAQIGRQESVEVSILHRSVSRQHARILTTPTGYELEDVGSVNGTWLNDKRLAQASPAQLRDGDRLMVGDIALSVELLPVSKPVPAWTPPAEPWTASALEAPVRAAPRAPDPSADEWPVAAGPGTVFYADSDALAAAAPAVAEPRPFDDTPVTRMEFNPPEQQRTVIEVDAPASPSASRVSAAPPPVPASPSASGVSAAPPAVAVPSTAPVARAPVLPGEPTAAGLIYLADQLDTALRLLKGDVALGLWLFEYAGGHAAVQSFVAATQRVVANPNDVQALSRLIELAPGAARLLEAATLLVNTLSSFEPREAAQDQSEANATNLQPVTRT